MQFYSSYFDLIWILPLYLYFLEFLFAPFTVFEFIFADVTMLM